jgi:phosphopantothenoylcysteine decarboxylase / phosphopantothenate---cysteine ligase
MLKGKKILLGVTGSIAAYKAAILVRLLVKEGATVKVLMTPTAKEFIAPLTLATLSQSAVLCDMFVHESGTWNSHVDLGMWADLYLVAPASATTMSKMAHGNADNLVCVTFLAAKCPVIIAPAMDLDMYSHPATLRNMEILSSYGCRFIEPASGELASGLVGKGRLEDPEIIVEKVKAFFQEKEQLAGKKVLVTAGPTYERIDPVRFIGNFSSGKMGYALAEELANRGAEVKLVSGPVSIKVENSKIELIKVTSAAEMYNKCVELFPHSHGAIMCAAVADYTPVSPSVSKLKRETNEMTIALKANKDIAAELGKLKKKNQFLVGFALETDNELDNAKRKIEKKNLDFVVLNSLNTEGAGFQVDTNQISIIEKSGQIQNFELKPKTEVAKDIVNKIFGTRTI